MLRPPRILLAAGGTGGHIYPAVALAEALRAAAPGVDIQFVCGSRPAEWQIYRRLGIEPWALPVAHHRPGLREHIKFVRTMLGSYASMRRRLRGAPVDVAVGFGGYVSVPPLIAARLSGARLALHEQNVHPGIANRLLARFCRVIATGAQLPRGIFPASRTHYVGNPLRAEILKPLDNPISRAEARAFFRLSPDRPVCAVIGGSQGALGLNRIVTKLMGRIASHNNPPGGDPYRPASRWQLLWSTGPAHFEQVSRALADLGVDPADHCVNPYIHEMPLAYAAADVVVARAGALTLAELTALGKPSILVPLPTAAGGHQLFNARAMQHAGAAELLEEADPRADEKLEAFLAGWLADPASLNAMHIASAALGRPTAAADLAQLILGLLPQPLPNRMPVT